MASKIKDKMLDVVTGGGSSSSHTSPSGSPPPSGAEEDKYLLQVTAGPSYDPATHRPVLVNSRFATPFENEHLRGVVQVHIRNYHGLPATAPHASPAYFGHPSRSKEQYSISYAFVPKHDVAAADTLWGNDFDHPVRDRLPPGFDLAVKIVKQFVDPTIELDAHADEPWMYAPAPACFFALRVGDKRRSAHDWTLEELQAMAERANEEPLQEGADGSGGAVREQLGMPADAADRRKMYRSKEALQHLTFEAGRLYQADFFNPYIDFGEFSLKLPGLTIKCIKYVNDKTHKLRYVFRNSATGDLYFCVILTLLFGDDLAEARRADEARWVKAKQVVSQRGPKGAGGGSATKAEEGQAATDGKGGEHEVDDIEVQRYYVSTRFSDYDDNE